MIDNRIVGRNITMLRHRMKLTQQHLAAMAQQGDTIPEGRIHAAIDQVILQGLKRVSLLWLRPCGRRHRRPEDGC